MERLKGLRPAPLPWDPRVRFHSYDIHTQSLGRGLRQPQRHNILQPKPPPSIKVVRDPPPAKPLWQQMNRHLGKRR